MPKPSEIFDTPEATSRVRGNEKLKLEFIQKWDSGQFEWNHHEGDKLGIKPNSLWRVWNEFIEPALTTKDQEKEEAIKAEKNKTINRVLNIVSSKQNQFTSTYERGYQEAVKNILQSIQRLLPTEDNK